MLELLPGEAPRALASNTQSKQSYDNKICYWKHVRGKTGTLQKINLLGKRLLKKIVDTEALLVVIRTANDTGIAICKNHWVDQAPTECYYTSETEKQV